MERRQKLFCELKDDELTSLKNEYIKPQDLKSPILKTIKASNSQIFKTETLSGETSGTLGKADHLSVSRDYLERAGKMRWFILTLSCFIMFGNFYAYDNPSALNRQLKAWMADKSDAEFEYHLNLLYTVYSAPNIVLPFVVGRALDRYGSRSFLIGLSLLMCLGQSVFSLGVSYKTWGWMLLGRLIFGLGGESLAVAQSRLVTEWFLGKELGIAIGLNLSVARIGTVFNNNASPRIANLSEREGGGVSGACWIGLATCLFSLLCTLFCILIDTLYRPNDSSKLSSKFKISSSLEDARASTSSLDNDEEFIHPSFYFLLILNFLSYGAVLCFNTVASAYLQERYFHGNIFKSNWAMSIPDTAAIFLVPIMGLVVDRSGLKLGTISLGQAALTIGHLWLALARFPSKPYGSLIILGIGYSTLLAIWSCVPYLVGSRRQATAYGYLTSSTNLSSTVLPMTVAALVSADQTYLRVGTFFAFLGAAGFAICTHIYSLNSSQSLGLNSSRVPNHMVAFYQISSSKSIDPKGLKGSRSVDAEAPVAIRSFRNQIIDERTCIYDKSC